MNMKDREFWFVVGSQHLYGPETLEQVKDHAREMARSINRSKRIPCRFVYKDTAKTSDEVVELVKQANASDKCCGIVAWCHTFSPSKLWINGLAMLQKPYCHFATQYNRSIPDNEIDMDFMNLNQAAHGDREHGYIHARMRLPRKIIMGYWKDADVLSELGKWMRSAVGAVESRKLKVCRFGDNMRNVAVTEGDKVGTQITLGWQVNTWAVGDLVKEMAAVCDAEVDELVDEYKKLYDFNTDNIKNVRYQAREEIALKRMLEREGAGAFTNTFEDLYGMEQLPGLATQRLMAGGYGFGAEGDWKVAAMDRIIKIMTEGMEGGSAFMEDYTYNLDKGAEYSLGAHMLEVDPSISAEKPRIECHPLGIGMNAKDPARLVFEGKAGKGTVASLVEMGGGLRLIVQDIEAIKPPLKMPNLPVARVTWVAMPNLRDGAKLWILAGGAHHTVLSFDADAQMLADWAELMGIEFVHIGKDTTYEGLKQQLALGDLIRKLGR